MRAPAETAVALAFTLLAGCSDGGGAGAPVTTGTAYPGAAGGAASVTTTAPGPGHGSAGTSGSGAGGGSTTSTGLAGTSGATGGAPWDAQTNGASGVSGGFASTGGTAPTGGPVASGTSGGVVPTTGAVATSSAGGGDASTGTASGGLSGLTGLSGGVSGGLVGTTGLGQDGGAGTTGGEGTATTGSTLPGGSVDPVIPAVSGECPTFGGEGTLTVGGLRGISMWSGPKGSGDGALLFYWHGTGSRAGEALSMVPADVRQEILSEGGILISPQGSLGGGRDCSGTSTFSPNDFEVMDQIVACAVRDHAINPRRIFTTGCSAGGLQAGCMAAQRSSYIAAATPNSGGSVFPQPIEDESRIPAILTMHGGSQDRVIVTFSETSATLDRQMKQAGGFVVNCDHGGGHCRAPAELYRAAWQFMKDHPFGLDASPYGTSLPASYPDYCAIY